MKLMTANEIATRLDLPRRTTLVMAGHRRLPAIKTGGIWLFDQDRVCQWVEQQILFEMENEPCQQKSLP
jgi:excisionase family DNA binding protein